VRAPALPLRVDPKMQTRSTLETGGTKGTLGVSPAKISPFPHPLLGGLGLALRWQQRAALLPAACLLVGSTRPE